MTPRTPEDWVEGPHRVRLRPDLTAEGIRQSTSDIWARACIALKEIDPAREWLWTTDTMRRRVAEDMLFSIAEMKRRADEEGVPYTSGQEAGLGVEGEEDPLALDALEAWGENWSRCVDYDRATISKAVTAEDAERGRGKLWDAHAFIMRWGTTEELVVRDRQLVDLWWWWVNRLVTPADLGAMAGLEKALERLEKLHGAAEQAEAKLRAQGYELQPDTRLLVEVRPSKKGPKPTLLAACAARTFEHMVAVEGRPRKNTLAVKKEICARLADRFHPDLLDPKKDGKIHSAINSHINQERDRESRKKRKDRRTKGG